MPLSGAHPAVEKRQLHVLQYVELGNQVVLLENKSQHLVSNLGLLVVVHRGHIHAAQQVGAGGGHIQTADDIHRSGFPGSGGSHNGDKFSLIHRHGHAVQGVHRLFTHLVYLIDVFKFDEVSHKLSHPSSCP